MALEHQTDILARALARYAEELKDKTKRTAITAAFCEQAQEIEDALWDLYQDTIDNAEGAQLDVFGAIVGQPRDAAEDEEYRLRIRARVLTNKSSGGVKEILHIFRVLLPDATLTMIPGYPASFTLTVSGVSVETDLQPIYLDFLRDAKAAGIYAILEFTEGDLEDAFTFDGGAIGLGFGDSTNPATGGEFAGALT